MTGQEQRVSAGVWLYVLTWTATAVVMVIGQATHATPVTASHVIAFSLFSSLSLLALRDQVFSVNGRVQYSWRHALQLTCALVLPPLLATLAAALPYSVLLTRLNRPHWHWRSRGLAAGLFNMAVAVVGLGATTFTLQAGSRWLNSRGLPELFTLLPATCVFVLLQTLPQALVVAIDRRVPLRRTGVLALDGMLGEAALAFIGATVGWFYLSEKLSLLLTLPPLLVVHRWLGKLQGMYADVQELNGKLAEANRGLIETLATVIDARDSSTYRHSYHVARYAVAIGEEMGLRADEQEELRRGALIHDIGKVGIPEAILFKPGRLTDEEYAVIKTHTTIGYRIVSQVAGLAHLAEVVRQHHERWSGGGYPLGHAGEAIPLFARIVCVADVLDVLLSDRPYRRAGRLQEALAELQRCSGQQFDPAVVDALQGVVVRHGESWFRNSARTAASQMP